MEVPSTDWREAQWDFDEALAEAPVKARNWVDVGEVRHTFTHFHLRLAVVTGAAWGQRSVLGQWTYLAEFEAVALPTVMKKVAERALAG